MVTSHRLIWLRPFLIWGALCLCLTVSACQDVRSDRVLALRRENTELTQRLEQASSELADLRQSVDAKDQEILKLQGFSDQRRGYLAAVQWIVLDRLTGGIDEDHDGYDDGVVVYLTPIDEDGHAVKVPGQVSIKVFDLNGTEPLLLGDVDIDPGELRKSWHGRFWTDHYTIRCPFRVRPTHTPITVRAAFVDMMTGREFTAQRTCQVKAAGPATTSAPVEEK